VCNFRMAEGFKENIEGLINAEICQMKRPLIYATLSILLCFELQAQCEIKFEPLDDSKFICPVFEGVTKPMNSFCQDFTSEYHFVFISLSRSIYYSVIIDKDGGRFESQICNMRLTKRNLDKIRRLLATNEPGKKITQTCDNEVRIGGQDLEFLALKINGTLSLVYSSADKNSESITMSKEERVKPLINLLKALKEFEIKMH
jgi:hypothetical protein